MAAAHAPYLETKPLHSSQVTLERQQEGVVIELFVQLNFELEKEILGFGEIIKVPVSYTHLDVYKRQVGFCAKMFFSQIGTDGIPAEVNL